MAKSGGSAAAALTPASEVVASLGSDGERGLTADEAGRRLAALGRNELPPEPPVPLWRRLAAQLANPLTGLLLLATAVSFAAWWIERESAVPFEALTILAIVVVNAVLGLVQEARAEHAVAALRAMTTPTAHVIRGGTLVVVATAELVPGDLIALEEGDTVPADGRLLAAIALRIAEATLTGESAPVGKDTAPLPAAVGVADQVNMVWKGTAVTSGRGRAVVTATGADTELGAIATSLQAVEDVATPLQRELDRTGRLLGIVVVAIAIVMSATIIVVGGARSWHELTDVLLLGVSLAVAAVPEGLTAITTVVLSLGVQRMAARHVIVRTLSAVETLGSTTIICTDKTGTLTRNEMTVRVVATASGRFDLGGTGYDPAGDVRRDGAPVEDEAALAELRLALSAGDLASNAALEQAGDRWSISGDPTEGALLVAARKVGVAHDRLLERFQRRAEVPFSSERKLMSTAHADRDDAAHLVVTTKGAPDVLLARCTAEMAGGAPRPLTDERRAAIQAVVEGLAGEALRTIGLATRQLDRDPGNGGAVDLGEAVEQELVWLGVVGMIDPPRPEAAAAVAVAQRAGIQVDMITGDHPSTAAAIGAELGIVRPGDRTVTGAELQRMSDDELRAVVASTRVFARVAPEHKLRIVRALKANGAVVAMTGDGVNDAPALKQADIGVAMGVTGTDVSKGAADMILTDDNFASIVTAVEEGRSLFANIQTFLRYLLSSNIGEVLVMFLGVVLAGVIGLAPAAGGAVVLPLLATQILWINLVTDSGPALALGVEPADAGVMELPARDPRRRVIDGPMWIDIVFVGAVMAAGTLGVMDWALPGGLLEGDVGSVERARTLAFTTLVFFQLFNVLNARSARHSAFRRLLRNRWLWLALGVSVGLHVAVIHVPFLQQAFATVPLSLAEWLVCVGAGSLVLWASELRKLVRALTRRGGAAPLPPAR
jgi:Ca2+-transporting ATPase